MLQSLNMKILDVFLFLRLAGLSEQSLVNVGEYSVGGVCAVPLSFELRHDCEGQGWRNPILTTMNGAAHPGAVNVQWRRFMSRISDYHQRGME